MNFLKKWFVLCWNIRGLNAKSKQLALMNAINNSGCSVICLQETKKEDFDLAFIKACCHTRFDEYVLSPRLVPLGGLLLFGIARFFLVW
jgi:exonuclease III